MIDQARVEREVLSSATEDWYRLWETKSTIEQMFPEDSSDAVLTSLRTAVELLFVRGLTKLSIENYLTNENRMGDPIEIRDEDALSVLSDDEVWLWRSYEVRGKVQLTATDAGRDAYFGSREAWDKRSSQAWTQDE